MKELVSSVYRYSLARCSSLSLDRLYQNSDLYLFSNARFALLEGLKIANASAGMKILIPAFMCCHLLAPLNMLGLRVSYYDLGEDLIPKLPELWPFADFIIAVNYFGFPQDLAPFRDYCQKTKAILIEDNAHGFLSKSEDGIPLGERGDLGITSPRKTINIPNGGILHLVRSDFKTKAKLNCSLTLPTAATKDYDFKLFFKYILSLIGAKNILGLINLNRKLRQIIKGYEVPLGRSIDEQVIPGNFRPCRINYYLSKCDQQFESRRRQDLYLKLIDFFCNLPVQIIFKKLPLHTVPMGFPFIFEFKDQNLIQDQLRKIGLEFYIWPSLPDAIKKKDTTSFYHRVGCVRFLW